MKTYASVCLILIFAVTAAARQTSQRKITGTVVDAKSGETIPNADVSLSGDAARSPATTDSNGFFELLISTSVQEGANFRIIITKRGYQTYSRTIDLSSNQNKTYPLTLSVPAKNETDRRAEGSSHRAENQAPNGFAISGGVVNNPTVNYNFPASAPEAAVPDDLREKGLTLSEEMDSFLKERQAHEVGPPPNVVISGGNFPNDDNLTPEYMRETRSLFVKRFESRIENLHDEFASRGLQSIDLDSSYNSIPSTAGNVDSAVTRISEDFRTLASLTPPQGIFRDKSDAQLAQMAIDEANRMDSMTNQAMSDLQHADTPDAVRFFFGRDFISCCLHQIEYLRAEILRRLGPSAYDAEEMRAFNGFNGLTSMETEPHSSVGPVIGYSPHLRKLGLKLMRTASPLPPPILLQFTQQESASTMPPAPLQLVVTIVSPRMLSSGYIAVEFSGRPAMLLTDLRDSKPVFQARDVYEDGPLADLISSNSANGMLYVLQIGKTPVSPSSPLHVIATSEKSLTVSRVTFFAEY